MKYRKGSAVDLIYLLTAMFVIALIWILVSYGAKAISQDTNSGATMQEYVGYSWQGFLGFNSVAIIFVIGIGMALVVSAFMVKTQPALFLLFFLLNMIAVVVSFSFSDVWTGVFNSSEVMQGLGSDFNLWGLLFQYLPAITLILGSIFAIAVFIGG